MKALARYGKAFGGYRMIEVPEPECGPEDIIIEIKAAAICGADMKHYKVDNGSDEFNSIRGVGVADWVKHSRFFVFHMFRNLPDGMFVNSQDFTGNLAVFGKSAAPGIVVQSQVYFMFAAEKISLFAGRAYAAYMGAVIRYHPLSYFPVLHQFPHFYNLSGKFMSPDGIKFIRSIVHFVVLHIRSADCRLNQRKTRK